jgi:hypothetical protein
MPELGGGDVEIGKKDAKTAEIARSRSIATFLNKI